MKKKCIICGIENLKKTGNRFKYLCEKCQIELKKEADTEAEEEKTRIENKNKR